mmetsp:Transcript_16753/g.42203  ORF Transcript_16753/g.42203 Transcript_16753/m.42203 type:complete len:216 (+) Transcript_16753:415-1062(+)
MASSTVPATINRCTVVCRSCDIRCTRPMACASTAGLSNGSTKKTCCASTKFRPLAPRLKGSSSARISGRWRKLVRVASSLACEWIRANCTPFSFNARSIKDSMSSHQEKIRHLSFCGRFITCSTTAVTFVPQLPFTAVPAQLPSAHCRAVACEGVPSCWQRGHTNLPDRRFLISSAQLTQTECAQLETIRSSAMNWKHTGHSLDAAFPLAATRRR